MTTTPQSLIERARAIGLPMADLARVAGVSRPRLYDIESGDNTSLRTYRKIERAVIACEQRVLAHLITLHPDHARALLQQGAAE